MIDKTVYLGYTWCQKAEGWSRGKYILEVLMTVYVVLAIDRCEMIDHVVCVCRTEKEARARAREVLNDHFTGEYFEVKMVEEEK